MNNPSQIILVSTLHYDPKGEERLRGLLTRLKPEIVTLEGSLDQRKYLTSDREKRLSREQREILLGRGYSAELVKKFDEEDSNNT